MELILDATAEDLKVFLEEAEEQLQLLDADLITLEKMGADAELLQEIFRVAHTLKGSSASIGHNRMAEITHAMESVLDGVRQGTIDISTELIDILLESLDALRVLTNEVITRKVSDANLRPLISRLLQIAQQDSSSQAQLSYAAPTAATSEVERQSLYEHEARGNSIYEITVIIDKNAPLAAARGLQILLELSALAEVIRSIPSQADFEMGKSSEKLSVVCATREDTDRIHSALASIVDVVAVSITPYRHDEATASQSAAIDERVADLGPQAAGVATDRRVIDLGPQARGKSKEDMLRMAAAKTAQLAKTVRIDVERLDNLMNLVGELVIDHTRLVQIAGRLQATHRDDEAIDRLAEVSSHLGRLTDELQQEIMKSRMLPVENVFNRFPRMVRNLAQKAGKEVDLVIQGQETELDRSVIEEISDPLIHLLRNAVDHGLETPEERRALGKPATGTIRLSAYHQENHIVITVEDDGRGIDPVRVKALAVQKGAVLPEVAERMTNEEAIELIFAAGFSTAEKVSEVSGRGVGMDIVRTNIERLNGSVSIETTLGRGSKFTIQLPLTLAIIPALLVSVADAVYAIPLVFVTETMRIDVSQIHLIRTREAVHVRGQVLPLLRLRDLFSLSCSGHRDEKRIFVVAVKHAGRQVGLVVDTLIGEQEVVIKSLGKYIGDVKGISGAAILGDGQVGLIVDVPVLIQVAIDEQMGRVVKQ